MMKHWILITSLLLFQTALAFASADPISPRDLSLEWDAIPGASSYDVEITSKALNTAKPQTFTSTEALWKGKLVPGYYTMRVRAKDRRQVPGDWSEATELTVLLEPPQSKTLKKEEKIEAKEAETTPFKFQWQAVSGADEYELKIETASGKLLQDLKIKDVAVEISLPVAETIKWTLQAQNQIGLVSEAPLQGQLEIWGPELATPEINKPSNDFVRSLEWTRPDYTQTYTYLIQALDKDSKKWKNLETKKDFPDSQTKFPSSWPGGSYKISVKATANLRKSSKTTSLQFTARDGDRSEGAEYSALLRQSIARTTGWFVVASYLVTAMQYKGTNADNDGAAPLQVELPNNFGGTGRLGAGWLSDRSPWGFLGIVDLSGFIVDGRNPTFASSEMNLVRRKMIGKTGEFRQHFGAFYKEVPEIIARDLTGIDRIDKIVALGPHYGAEYWWAMSPKLGLQANAHLYSSLITVKTPTGSPVAPSLSYQIGMLGSYRLGERATGLMGYAYRQDAQSYNSKSGRTNSVNITGHYFNLFLEWAL